MLNVSELMAVSKGDAGAGDLRERLAHRFDPGERRQPVIVWNVCHHCNMSCPHCYAAATEKPSRFDLTTEEGLELIDRLADAGIRVLIFSGGEPLLRDDLFELIEAANDRGLSTHLSTNGTKIDRDVAERLANAGIGYVGVSIDGLPEFNDPYRGLEDGFDLATRGIVHAGDAGMKTGLRITLTRRNQHHLDPVLEHARSIGVDRFYVSHLLYAGRGAAIEGDDLTPEESRETLTSLFERADDLLTRGSGPAIVTGGNDSDGPFLLEWLRGRYGAAAAEPVAELLEMRGGNSAGEGILNIDSRGRVHPDQFWRTQTLGNVRRDTLEDILNHPLRRQLAERSTHLEGRCGSCRFREMCRGSHRERALARHDDLWGPDPACVMTDTEIAESPPLPNLEARP